MDISSSQKRLIENEMIFRGANQKVQRALVRLKKSAEIEGIAPLSSAADIPLYFYCECSDRKCRERIMLKPSAYQKLHKDRSRFLVLPGHQTPKVEKVIKSTKNYTLVEKPQLKS
jgi:hypothetical protein